MVNIRNRFGKWTTKNKFKIFKQFDGKSKYSCYGAEARRDFDFYKSATPEEIAYQGYTKWEDYDIQLIPPDRLEFYGTNKTKGDYEFEELREHGFPFLLKFNNIYIWSIDLQYGHNDLFSLPAYTEKMLQEIEDFHWIVTENPQQRVVFNKFLKAFLDLAKKQDLEDILKNVLNKYPNLIKENKSNELKNKISHYEYYEAFSKSSNLEESINERIKSIEEEISNLTTFIEQKITELTDKGNLNPLENENKYVFHKLEIESSEGYKLVDQLGELIYFNGQKSDGEPVHNFEHYFTLKTDERYFQELYRGIHDFFLITFPIIERKIINETLGKGKKTYKFSKKTQFEPLTSPLLTTTFPQYELKKSEWSYEVTNFKWIENPILLPIEYSIQANVEDNQKLKNWDLEISIIKVKYNCRINIKVDPNFTWQLKGVYETLNHGFEYALLKDTYKNLERNLNIDLEIEGKIKVLQNYFPLILGREYKITHDYYLKVVESLESIIEDVFKRITYDPKASKKYGQHIVKDNDKEIKRMLKRISPETPYISYISSSGSGFVGAPPTLGEITSVYGGMPESRRKFIYGEEYITIHSMDLEKGEPYSVTNGERTEIGKKVIEFSEEIDDLSEIFPTLEVVPFPEKVYIKKGGANRVSFNLKSECGPINDIKIIPPSNQYLKFESDDIEILRSEKWANVIITLDEHANFEEFPLNFIIEYENNRRVEVPEIKLFVQTAHASSIEAFKALPSGEVEREQNIKINVAIKNQGFEKSNFKVGLLLWDSKKQEFINQNDFFTELTLDPEITNWANWEISSLTKDNPILIREPHSGTIGGKVQVYYEDEVISEEINENLFIIKSDYILNIENCNADPSFGQIGEKVILTSFIKNDGGRSAPIQCQFEVISPDKKGIFVSELIKTEIPPGESKNARIEFIIPEHATSGNYKVKVSLFIDDVKEIEKEFPDILTIKGMSELFINFSREEPFSSEVIGIYLFSTNNSDALECNENFNKVTTQNLKNIEIYEIFNNINEEPDKLFVSKNEVLFGPNYSEDPEDEANLFSYFIKNNYFNVFNISIYLKQWELYKAQWLAKKRTFFKKMPTEYEIIKTIVEKLERIIESYIKIGSDEKISINDFSQMLYLKLDYYELVKNFIEKSIIKVSTEIRGQFLGRLLGKIDEEKNFHETVLNNFKIFKHNIERTMEIRNDLSNLREKIHVLKAKNDSISLGIIGNKEYSITIGIFNESRSSGQIYLKADTLGSDWILSGDFKQAEGGFRTDPKLITEKSQVNFNINIQTPADIADEEKISIDIIPFFNSEELKQIPAQIPKGIPESPIEAETTMTSAPSMPNDQRMESETQKRIKDLVEEYKKLEKLEKQIQNVKEDIFSDLSGQIIEKVIEQIPGVKMAKKVINTVKNIEDEYKKISDIENVFNLADYLGDKCLNASKILLDEASGGFISKIEDAAKVSENIGKGISFIALEQKLDEVKLRKFAIQNQLWSLNESDGIPEEFQYIIKS